MKLAIFVKNPDLRQDNRCRSLCDALAAEGMELYDIASHADLRAGTDMLLSIGGDGTFLSAAKRVEDAGIPILGVNLGRLGFLSEYRPEEVLDALRKRDWTVEDRILLNTELEGVEKDAAFCPYSLNEVSLHRSGAAMLGVDVTLDGQALPTYWADGMLVATSSGSTAYSLSVGGPICRPDAPVLIIAPIAPHNLNVRPLIVPDTARIGLTVQSRDPEVLVTLDNRRLSAPSSLRMEISVARFSLKRIRLGKSNFVKALTSKLFWGEDVRNTID